MKITNSQPNGIAGLVSNASNASGVGGIPVDTSTPPTDGQVLVYDDGTGTWVPATAAGSGAPATVNYLVGTADAGLSAEIVVGTTPGGELGNTWASPTVDATHSGSSHAGTQTAAEATAAGALATHDADTTSVHGITNTANLYAVGGTDVAVADGGTGASTAAGARTNLDVPSNAEAILDTFVAAKGDLLTATANDTPAIQTVGADDTILMADAAQTNGLKWVASQTPSTQAFADAAAQGTADTYARGDHKHAMPANPTIGLTVRLPILLDTPDATGNGYPALSTNNGFSNVRRVVPAFTKDVVGTWEGSIRIPANFASGAKIVSSYVANATAGVYRDHVSTAVVAVTVTEDTAYTDETAADTTVPGTARQRFDVSTTLTTTVVANSTLNVKITHEGTHANDTLAVDCLLWECLFEYTT